MDLICFTQNFVWFYKIVWLSDPLEIFRSCSSQSTLFPEKKKERKEFRTEKVVFSMVWYAPQAVPASCSVREIYHERERERERERKLLPVCLNKTKRPKNHYFSWKNQTKTVGNCNVLQTPSLQADNNTRGASRTVTQGWEKNETSVCACVNYHGVANICSVWVRVYLGNYKMATAKFRTLHTLHPSPSSNFKSVKLNKN